MPMAVPAPNAAQGLARTDDRPKVFNQLCIACHALGGQGGNVGPPLDAVGDRHDAEYIKRWLRDPFAVKSNSRMPKLPITEEQVQELSAFLAHQTKSKAPGADGAEAADGGAKEQMP